MKKILLVTALLIGSVSATFAADHRVTVANFQFTPKTVNARVGDTISWSWQTGSANHTTTSTSVPKGAASWDAQLNAATPKFRYRITTAGTYRYQCSFHFAMGMKGTIRVSASSAGATEKPTAK